MLTFREPCNPLHSGQGVGSLMKLQGSRNVGIPRMNLPPEETREMHNLYIESTHGSLKKYYVYIYLLVIRITLYIYTNI